MKLHTGLNCSLSEFYPNKAVSKRWCMHKKWVRKDGGWTQDGTHRLWMPCEGGKEDRTAWLRGMSAGVAAEAHDHSFLLSPLTTAWWFSQTLPLSSHRSLKRWGHALEKEIASWGKSKHLLLGDIFTLHCQKTFDPRDAGSGRGSQAEANKALKMHQVFHGKDVVHINANGFPNVAVNAQGDDCIASFT